MMKKLAIGNDHAATDLKFEIMDYLREKGYEVINVGTDEKTSFNDNEIPYVMEKSHSDDIDERSDCALAAYYIQNRTR